MKNKFTILGCGSSLGTPWINDNWGKCKKKDKNIRTRCCAHLQYGNISILIDTSPDIKAQLIKNKIKKIDSIIFTHFHSDQVAGIFEFRPFYWSTKKKISVYADNATSKHLLKKYKFLFKGEKNYPPIMDLKIIKNKFSIIKKKKKIIFRALKVLHGKIFANGYLFGRNAYISDCNKIPKNIGKNLYNLNHLIIDAFRIEKYPTHFSLQESLAIIKKFKPKKAILTNLHNDLDYYYLKKKLPRNIIPAFDGLSFNF